MVQCHTQARNITTNIKVKVDFILPTLSTINVMTWNFCVDESAQSIYDMILGQYILTEFRLSINVSKDVIKSDGGPFKGSTTPMVDLGKYIFKDLNIGKIKPE